MRSDTIGPCVGCGAPHERYGPGGRPHCAECFPDTAAAVRQEAGHQAVIRTPKAEPRQPEPDAEPELSLF
jgi:hypothetical protein